MHWRVLWATVLLGLVAAPLAYAAATIAPVEIGHSTVTLYGPWKFKTGDDPRWARPQFDDTTWQGMDLTPPPGATDGDVGLEGFAPGWGAKGHRGYHGYAWYRIRLTVRSPAGERLALLGPWAVDSAYQIYANGQLLGGVGDFSGATPVAYSYHAPRYFTLPADIAKGGAITIAVRTWAGPWVAGAQSGGIHIAPVIGEQNAVLGQYRLQWLTIFEGYVGDAAIGVLFALMAFMVLCLRPFERGNSAYPWLAAALLLSAIQRGNQAFFFWLDVESIKQFVYFIMALAAALSLAAWTMAWRAWFKAGKPAWLPHAVAVLAGIFIVARLLSLPWLFAGAVPAGVAAASSHAITWVRLAFIVMLAWIVYRGLRFQGREAWFALPAVLAMCGFLYSPELSAIHLSGIWFPWGIGVSFSEYASLVFDTLLAILLLRRLWSHAGQGALAHS